MSGWHPSIFATRSDPDLDRRKNRGEVGTRTAVLDPRKFLLVSGAASGHRPVPVRSVHQNRAFGDPVVPRIGAFAQVRVMVVASRRVRRIPFLRSADLPKRPLTCENTVLWFALLPPIWRTRADISRTSGCARDARANAAERCRGASATTRRNASMG